MDRLKQIESFAAVATKGSLTAAANAEGVAPAVIGRRIDALEERLGVKLLVRTTRRITLTHEGSAFLEDCQRILAELANAGSQRHRRRRQSQRPLAHHRAGRLRAPARGAAGAQVPEPASRRAACR